jgi:hypothetical protein
VEERVGFPQKIVVIPSPGPRFGRPEDKLQRKSNFAEHHCVAISWMPAFAGMTIERENQESHYFIASFFNTGISGRSPFP